MAKYRKVIVSGNVIEVYEMDEKPIIPETNIHKNDNEKILDKEFFLERQRLKKWCEQTGENFESLWSTYVRQYNEEEKEKKKKLGIIQDRKEERRKQTTRDARNKVRRLVLSNFSNHSKFMTLTFKDNITDIDIANKIFKKYIRVLRERFTPKGKKFKYIAVIEFQERGAVHYHMICNLPYTKHSLLWDEWKKIIGNEGYKPEGSVNIKDITEVDNVGAYITKYMTKDIHDKRLKKRKSYLCSKGLEQPKEYKEESAEWVIKTYELENKKVIFTNSYKSEYHGKIVYKEYNLNPNKLYRENTKNIG